MLLGDFKWGCSSGVGGELSMLIKKDSVLWSPIILKKAEALCSQKLDPVLACLFYYTFYCFLGAEPERSGIFSCPKKI